MTALNVLNGWLRSRLTPPALAWLGASGEVSEAAFAPRFSAASRHARDRTPLAPTAEECGQAGELCPGWNPERWTLLETLRVALLLGRPNVASAAGDQQLLELFRYADEGEQRALYRSLALHPNPAAFQWRAGEGCRTNMVSVFEAVVLDTPYPRQHFDEVAWRQAVIKCVFVGAPLWRLWGLDERLDEDLARMALDLVEERRSAHREVQPELWACLGPHGGGRAARAIEAELDAANGHAVGRRAAALALGRRGDRASLEAHLARETQRAGATDAEFVATLRAALAQTPHSTAFGALQ